MKKMKLATKLWLLMIAVLGLIATVDIMRVFFFALRMAIEGVLALAFFGLAFWAWHEIEKHRHDALNDQIK